MVVPYEVNTRKHSYPNRILTQITAYEGDPFNYIYVYILYSIYFLFSHPF